LEEKPAKEPNEKIPLQAGNLGSSSKNDGIPSSIDSICKRRKLEKTMVKETNNNRKCPISPNVKKVFDVEAINSPGQKHHDGVRQYLWKPEWKDSLQAKKSIPLSPLTLNLDHEKDSISIPKCNEKRKWHPTSVSNTSEPRMGRKSESKCTGYTENIIRTKSRHNSDYQTGLDHNRSFTLKSFTNETNSGDRVVLPKPVPVTRMQHAEQKSGDRAVLPRPVPVSVSSIARMQHSEEKTETRKANLPVPVPALSPNRAIRNK
jgi:hypothetical protein